MGGALLVILAVALVVGWLGRLVMPGRRGLLRLGVQDPRLLRRFALHDVELRWELGAALIGASSGYVMGRMLDAWAGSTTSARWVMCVVMAIVLTAIAVASGLIERSRFTRKLGIHHRVGGAQA